MTDYFTIKIPEPEGDRHNARRQDLGLTWAEYIDGQAPEEPGWLADLRAELSNNAEGDGGALGSGVDEAALADALADDLVARLPPRIAEELR